MGKLLIRFGKGFNSRTVTNQFRVPEYIFGMHVHAQNVQHLRETNGGLHVPASGVDVGRIFGRLALGQEHDGVLVLLVPNHWANVGVEAGKDDSPVARVLQHAFQYYVDVGVDVQRVSDLGLVSAVLLLHRRFNLDVKSHVRVQRFESLLQSWEGLVLLQTLVEETLLFRFAFR